MVKINKITVHDYCDYCGQKVVVGSNEKGRILCDTCESHEKDKADIVDHRGKQIAKLKRKNEKLSSKIKMYLNKAKKELKDLENEDMVNHDFGYAQMYQERIDILEKNIKQFIKEKVLKPRGVAKINVKEMVKMIKTKDDFDNEELCEYCPLQAELDEVPPPATPRNPMGCGGMYCDEAYDNYKEIIKGE